MRRSVLKPHATLFSAVLRACDPAVAALIGLVAYRAYLGSFVPPEHYLLFLGASALAIAALFPLFRLYQPQRGVNLGEEIRQLLFAWALVAALVGGTIFATKSGVAFSRVWVGAWLLGGFAATATLRIALRLGLRTLRRRGLNQRHVVIVGAGELGCMIAERLRVSPWTGFSVTGVYDDDPEKLGRSVAGYPVRGSADRLAADVAIGGIDQVWIALPLRAEGRVHEILSALREHSVEVRLVPDIYSFHLLNHSVTEVAGLPVISLTETPMSGTNRVVKAIEDYVLATVFLVATSPAMAAIALGVKLSSPGPAFYRQERLTWNGERFRMFKFRTMPVDAEAATGPVWANPGELRATPFGAFLRRTSLDELPQFLNVLRGEMSIVGPRPERPEFVDRFKQEIPGYMQKHFVKAGITGWAQINDFRGSTDLRERIRYDLYYVENWSVWFDLRIIALTIMRVLHSRNAY
jgi:putative colanic acid biosysnthesis UDP-glucose lipid carrier transferase